MIRVTALTLALLLGGGASAGLATPLQDRRAVARGAGWLERQPLTIPAGQQADLIVALRAAGTPSVALRPRVRALARSGPAYALNPGQAAKIAQAAMAVGANPRRFGKVNYIGRINRGYRNGRYGRDAFSHALALLALAQSRRRIPRRAIRELSRTRGGGGWSFQLKRTGTDEVDTTALVIRALRAAGVSRGNKDLREATSWLRRQRNRRGGFDSRGGRRATEANSTAAAVLALTAMGKRTATERREIRTLQQRNGSFWWRRSTTGSTLLATLDALSALT